MSTPVVAGGALLVREYLTSSSAFVDHLRATAAGLAWDCLPGYPVGGCLSGGSAGLALTGSASGALVKALLLHATVPMSAWDATDASGTASFQALGGAPDFQQGFGRLDLSLALLSATSTPALGGRGLWCSDDESVASLSFADFSFHVVSPDKPLVVTVVWHDPPNSVAAAKQLLHDLDLSATFLPTGQTVLANGAVSVADELNNVEKISWQTPPVGNYRIRVSASLLTAAATQAFGMVITGAGYYVAPGYTWERLESGEGGPTTPPTLSPPPSPAPTPPPDSKSYPAAHSGTHG